MNASATITKMLAAMPKAADRAALIKAHEVAAEFHEAMGRALTAEAELEDDIRNARRDPEWESEVEITRERYRKALGDVADALQTMPIKWAAILNEQVPAVKPEGSDA